jgi:hypothetical protein
MERNIDIDIDCHEASAEDKVEKNKKDKGSGKRRHSLAATLNFLHLN